MAQAGDTAGLGPWGVAHPGRIVGDEDEMIIALAGVLGGHVEHPTVEIGIEVHPVVLHAQQRFLQQREITIHCIGREPDFIADIGRPQQGLEGIESSRAVVDIEAQCILGRIAHLVIRGGAEQLLHLPLVHIGLQRPHQTGYPGNQWSGEGSAVPVGERAVPQYDADVFGGSDQVYLRAVVAPGSAGIVGGGTAYRDAGAHAAGKTDSRGAVVMGDSDEDDAPGHGVHDSIAERGVAAAAAGGKVDHVGAVGYRPFDAVGPPGIVAPVGRVQHLHGHDAAVPVHAGKLVGIVAGRCGSPGDCGAVVVVVGGIVVRVGEVISGHGPAGKLQQVGIESGIQDRQDYVRVAAADIPGLDGADVRGYGTGAVKIAVLPLGRKFRVVGYGGRTVTDIVRLGIGYRGIGTQKRHQTGGGHAGRNPGVHAAVQVDHRACGTSRCGCRPGMPAAPAGQRCFDQFHAGRQTEGSNCFLRLDSAQASQPRGEDIPAEKHDDVIPGILEPGTRLSEGPIRPGRRRGRDNERRSQHNPPHRTPSGRYAAHQEKDTPQQPGW